MALEETENEKRRRMKRADETPNLPQHSSSGENPKQLLGVYWNGRTGRGRPHGSRRRSSGRAFSFLLGKYDHGESSVSCACDSTQYCFKSSFYHSPSLCVCAGAVSHLLSSDLRNRHIQVFYVWRPGMAAFLFYHYHRGVSP